MHIVHLVLTSKFAGSERYALELGAAQAADHRVTLILRKEAAGKSARNILSHVDPSIEIILVNNFFRRFQARAVLKRLKPDIAHAHLSEACKAIEPIGHVCKRVATLHICYKKRQHRHLDGLIAIAPWQLPSIHPALRPHSVHINNWTLEKKYGQNARMRLRGSLGIAEDDFVFGSIGRIEKSKGMDVLIDAHQKLADPGTKLVILGDGSNRRNWQKRLSSGQFMPGFSTEPENWMLAFDCFVSASRSEPFGLAILEAMQAGCPVIATKSHGAQHLSGYLATDLVTCGDAAALCKQLMTSLEKGQRRQEYRMDDFRIGTQVVAVEDFYRRILSGRTMESGTPGPQVTG